MSKLSRSGANIDFSILPVCRRLLELQCVPTCAGHTTCPRGNLRTLRQAYGETIRDFLMKLSEHGLKVGDEQDVRILVATYHKVEGRDFLMRLGKPLKPAAKLAQIMLAMATWAKADPVFASNLTGYVDNNE